MNNMRIHPEIRRYHAQLLLIEQIAASNYSASRTMTRRNSGLMLEWWFKMWVVKISFLARKKISKKVFRHE